MSIQLQIESCLDLAAACVRDARLLLASGSRNAAYLASQAAEHVITAVATSVDLHIERKDAHQLDTIVRRLPEADPARDALRAVTFFGSLRDELQVWHPDRTHSRDALRRAHR